ncbi:MAG: hypothetical protein RL108_1895 [Bacteroidota bacterium]|jgi:hypothetical protein
MNREQRNKVNQDQINKFFSSYYTNWRLNQILTNEKILNEKFDFYASIIKVTKQPDDNNGDSTIAQEITNGLLFESISCCVQFIEDLFALLKAGENKDHFIKNIITYNAGKIQNFITQNLNEEQLCKSFHFPYYIEGFDDERVNEVRLECIARLFEWIQEIKEFHAQHSFFYNQYKHGLTVALRPYYIYGDEQIQKSKDGDFEPYLAAFDSLAMSKLKDKKARFSKMMFIPCFTENVKANVKELMNEDNLVRYVFPPQETNMVKIKDIAFKVRDCINIVGNNIMAEAENEISSKIVKFQLPASEINKVCSFRISETPDENTATKQ